MSYTLHIHGHSCCEVRGDTFSFICDPWLLGSAYWRSWWNFPKSESLDQLIDLWNIKKSLYIYITHQHWDHFHGPTLRRISKYCKNATFIIPQTPEPRIKDDLFNILPNAKIIELIHAKTYRFNEIYLKSFQTGPITSDSVIAIYDENFCVLNMNDAKLMPLSLGHLNKIIPNPDITLRSHSSANSRCCKRDVFGNKRTDIIDKTRFEYTKEFLDSCYLSNAKIAIPFASNMVHLHEETEKYNKVCNFSDYVENDFKKLRMKYKGMDCKMLLPGENINLANFKINTDKTLREKIYTTDRQDLIQEIKVAKQNLINRQKELERNTVSKDKLINKFFKYIIENTPLLFKLYLSDYIHIISFSENSKKIFKLNFKNNQVEEVRKITKQKNIVTIKVKSYVLNDVCKHKNYNSLGISKRLEIRSQKGNLRYEIFNMLCNSIESGGPIPIKNLISKSYLFRWLRRFREIIDLCIFLISKLSKKSFFRL